jgi:hypothetical protein
VKSTNSETASQKPKKIRFKKREVEVIKKRLRFSRPVKDAVDSLDHSYQTDVQRESF